MFVSGRKGGSQCHPVGNPRVADNHRRESLPSNCLFLECLTRVEDKRGSFLKRDFLTRDLNSRRQLNPGEKFDFQVSLEEIRKFSSKGFTSAIVRDEINRVYRSNERISNMS
jgi:hypothetical protein